jgi:transposase-like protein
MSILSEPHFHNEAAAIARLEAIIWPEGPICPHCGGVSRITPVKGGRIGLRRCGDCKKQFTCKVGTVFESSHVAVHKWFQAAHLMASSKKGISAHQLHRTLKVTYKTAWFIAHRLREAMRVVGAGPMGGAGQVVEIDETLMGKVEGAPKRLRTGGSKDRNIVVTLVERGGSARSFHVDGKAISDVMPIVRENVKRETRINTDEAKLYYDLHKEFSGHDTVNHSADEYVRYTSVVSFPEAQPYIITTNTVEGYYSIFKRGMKGIYQHCAEKHLHRYLAEFDFRYSNRSRLGVDDNARTSKMMFGIIGKRLTYRWPNSQTVQP